MAEWRVVYPVILLQVTPLPSLAKLWTTCEWASLHFVLSAFVIVIVWEFLQYEFHPCYFFPRISVCFFCQNHFAHVCLKHQHMSVFPQSATASIHLSSSAIASVTAFHSLPSFIFTRQVSPHTHVCRGQKRMPCQDVFSLPPLSLPYFCR